MAAFLPTYHLAAPAQLSVGPDAAGPNPLDAPVQSFHVAGASLSAALQAVTRTYGVTFVIDPAVKGDVTMELRRGTVRDLIDALTQSQGCFWERAGRLIIVRRNVTRYYEIDYPQLARSSQGGSNVVLSAQSGFGSSAPPAMAVPSNSSGATGSGPNDQTNLTILQQNQNTFWSDVQSELTSLAQPGETAFVNKFAGLAAVTAPPTHQRDFQAFIDTVNRRISRQIRIAARVVEVELNAQHQLGVDWSLVNATAGGLTLTGLGTATGFSSINGQSLGARTLSGTLSTGKISAVIQALAAQGDVHAVSNPSVLSLSNQTAFVKVGTEQTFFSLSNSTTINQGGATGPVATTQSSYTQNAITIGTVLSVTPEVNGDGTVTVDVLPAITQLVGVDTSPDGQQTAPRMDIKALSTIARLHPDQSVMIGGLIYDATATQSQKVPLLGDLPLLGRAFGTSGQTKMRTELVIFLTAEPVN
jgi:MSHA biogenesis protein MshL